MVGAFASLQVQSRIPLQSSVVMCAHVLLAQDAYVLHEGFMRKAYPALYQAHLQCVRGCEGGFARTLARSLAFEAFGNILRWVGGWPGWWLCGCLGGQGSCPGQGRGGRRRRGAVPHRPRRKVIHFFAEQPPPAQQLQQLLLLPQRRRTRRNVGFGGLPKKIRKK